MLGGCFRKAEEGGVIPHQFLVSTLAQQKILKNYKKI